MNHNGENKMELQMKKKPLSLRMKQKCYNVGYLIKYILSSLVLNRQSKFWCKIGLHAYVPTAYEDFKCGRCGRWVDCNTLLSVLTTDTEDESEDKTEEGFLKDCPFCGSDDVFFIAIVENVEVIDDAFEISCGNCQITFSCGDSTKEEIAALWNRRKEDAK